jgi:hypothetical protein
MKIIRSVLILFCFFLFKLSFAQNSDKIETNEYQYFTIAPRFGIGYHNYLNCEVGLSGIYINDSGLEFGAASAYSTCIFQQSDWNSGFNTYGFKVGVQSSWAIFMWGLEWESLFYDNSNYNYLSPKVGLSYLDVFNIEYAINLLERNKTIPINSKHQFSININLNRKIFRTLKRNF